LSVVTVFSVVSGFSQTLDCTFQRLQSG
jgi:hypothetical protein